MTKNEWKTMIQDQLAAGISNALNGRQTSSACALGWPCGGHQRPMSHQFPNKDRDGARSSTRTS